MLRGEQSDAHAGETGEKIAPRGERLQQPERRRACLVRHRVRDERDREPEDATDTEPGEKTIDAEIDKAGRERTQAGAHRVEQHRDRENARTAVTIAER